MKPTIFLALTCAISIALGFSENKSKKIITYSTSSRNIRFDGCIISQKRWFIININCHDQNNLNLTILRNPQNYSLFDAGLIAPDKIIDCPGNDCLCAIFACPTFIGGIVRPLINTGTDIYYDLGTYSSTGGLVVPSSIIEKGIE